MSHLSPINDAGVLRAHQLIDLLTDESLVTGFHGIVSIEITIRDGTIQEVKEGREKKHRPQT